LEGGSYRQYYCNICSHEWTVPLRPVGRFRSIEDVVQRTGLRRDELTTLADIGALNAFTNERRSALWQVERVVRPAGELFADAEHAGGAGDGDWPDRRGEGEPSARTGYGDRPERIRDGDGSGRDGSGRLERPERSPLRPMTDDERLQADYGGTGLTIGPHPMALRREEMSLRGVLRACDLPHTRDGRRVRVAGMVITRQRPGTAKGFVFLTLEDETGISNVIVRPDLFDRQRLTLIRQPFLIVDGVLQHQDGVLSVRAERVEGMTGGAAVDAHDFY
jgi:error-prone DNA polymerase